MFGTEAVALGITLTLIGAGLWLVARTMTQLGEAVTRGAMPLALPADATFAHLQNDEDAVVVVLAGGRVGYLNARAREWFGLLPEDQPSLEFLAQRIRPSDEFIRLSAAPGRARLTLSTRALEGASFAVPSPEGVALVVTLRPARLMAAAGEQTAQGAPPSEALKVLLELGEQIGSRLDLEEAIRAVAEAVDRLLPSDVLEITLWDERHQGLVPHRYMATGRGVEAVPAPARYAPDEGLTGYLVGRQQPLLLDDIDRYTPVPPAVDRRRHPLRAYMGVPLKVGEEMVGTLEVALFSPAAYSRSDLEFLALIGREVALALHNARLFSETRRRLEELRSLAGIARSVGGARQVEELVGRILENIRPLLPAEMLGFLLYDEVHRTLAAQWPFVGLPEGFVAAYQTRIPAGSEAEALLLAGEPLTTEEAAADARWQTLGLDELNRTAGVHASVLYPLTTGERFLGFLQAANKPDGSPFGDDDLQVLTLIAAQVAPLLENAVLFQEARQRARRAEALRRIASLTASPATLDELFKFSLVELARLVDARYAAVLLLDEHQTQLAPHEPSLFGISPEKARAIGTIPSNAPDFPLTVTRSGRPFLSADLTTDRRVIAAYRPLLRALGDVRSAIVVPLQAHGENMGEILLGHPQTGHFDRNDLQLAAATAAQMAIGVERQRLLGRSDAALRTQVQELSTLTRLSRELAAFSSLEQLLAYAHEQMVALTEADCGQTMLVAAGANGGWKVLHHTGGPCEFHFHPLDHAALEHGTPEQVADYRVAAYPQPHEGVRASLALPLRYQNTLVGVIHLHSRHPNHFSGARQQFARLLAQHIALAVGSARHAQNLFQENVALQRQVRALHLLQRYLQKAHPLEAPREAVEAFVTLVREALGFDAVLLTRLDENGHLQPVASVGMETLQPIRWDDLSLLLEDRFQQHGVYFIPQEERPRLPASLALPEISRPMPAHADARTWHPRDLLLAPLRTTQGEPLGLLYLDAPSDARRPDAPAQDILRLFAATAAWLLQVQHLADEWETDRQRLTDRVAEAEAAARQAQNNIPRWLHKDLQQTLDRYALARQAERLRISLEITALLNRQPSHTAVLQTLGRQLMERFGFNYVLIAEPTPFVPGATEEGGVRLLQTFGELPPALKLDMLLGQRNPLAEAFHQKQVLVVSDIDRTPEWQRSPLLQRLQAQSFVAFPVLVEQQGSQTPTVDHIVLATSSMPTPSFTAQDEMIFDLVGRQVGIVLQNLDLLAHTSRRLQEVDLLLTFSRQLGVLDPNRILQTLMESTLSALQHAHAGFVALWNAERGELQPQVAGGYADAGAMLAITFPQTSLPAQVMLEGRPRRIGELDFAAAYPLASDALTAYRRATADRIPVSSMMVPIRAGERPLGVIVLDNFNTTAAFTREDQSLVVSLAGQTALTLENARLLRTAERRASQLHALAGASSGLVARSLSLEEVETSLLEHLAAVLPYDGGTLWLREGNRLQVRDARGFPNAEELLGITIAVEDSRLFQEMLDSGQALVVEDTHADDRFPAPEAVPNRSWLGLPLRFKDEVLGVIALEKQEPGFFTRDWVETAETFAGQAAAALGNARLYEEVRRHAEELDHRTRRLALVYEVTAELSASLDPAYIAEYTTRRLHEALGNRAVSFVLLEDETPTLLATAPAPKEQPLPQTLPFAPVFAHLAESLGVLADADVHTEPLLQPLEAFLAARAPKVTVVPLPAGQTLFGTLFIHLPEKASLTGDEIELVQTLAKQAAVALQNARLYAASRRFTEELEARVADRTRRLQQEHHRAQTLLRIITELSASLDLDQVLNRTLDLLNDALSAEQSSILLKRPDAPTLFLRAGRGYAEQPPLGGRPTDISATDSFAGWIIAHNQAVLVPDLQKDPRWRKKDHGLPISHRSVIGVPLVVAQDVLGALLLFHSQPHHFTDYHLDLASATARQVAVAINNAELFNLIREQAERLGGLLRQQEVEASRARAILEAIADGVLVTDRKGVITLFNSSAERILGLPAGQALNRPLEHFVGLFGREGRQWMETIHHWSAEPEGYRDQEVAYEERLELEDGRVVSVHLAPVFYRKDFLGTVSVFRDITHQVEVDRLKSEFVATVSHELRTPMTAIKGYVDILLMGAAGPLTDQQQKFLETVKSNTERLNLLVGDLLDISRIEAGRISLALEAVDLAALLQEVVAEQARVAKEEGRSMTFSAEIPADLPPVYGDRERVRQIAENLVENAYRYTPEGGRVVVRARRAGDAVQVDVQDTGIGIPPEEQPRVFERFYRGENPLVMASAGTGLGLSIVRTLVEMHGGRIWLESSGVPGEGSTFSFTLPVLPPELEDSAGEA